MLFLIAALVVGAPPSVWPGLSVRPVATASDSTPVLFARARDEARQARSGPAIDAYLAGSRLAASSTDWGLYRRDIFWVASPSELKAFDAADPAERVAFLDTFWSSRDARDQLVRGGRFVEHVRRVDVAMAEYRVHPKKGKAPVSRASVRGGDTDFDYTVGHNSMLRDYAPGQGVIDDRGVILIRHGEPTARAASSIGVESWVYERDDRDNLVVHFSENVFDGSSGNTRLIAAPPVSALESLCGLDAASCTVAQRFGGASVERRERLRQRALTAIRELTTTESAAVRSE